MPTSAVLKAEEFSGVDKGAPRTSKRVGRDFLFDLKSGTIVRPSRQLATWRNDFHRGIPTSDPEASRDLEQLADRPHGPNGVVGNSSCLVALCLPMERGGDRCFSLSRGVLENNGHCRFRRDS
jgi:hypothetical protein